jgi:hypothetical protein
LCPLVRGIDEWTNVQRVSALLSLSILDNHVKLDLEPTRGAMNFATARNGPQRRFGSMPPRRPPSFRALSHLPSFA